MSRSSSDHHEEQRSERPLYPLRRGAAQGGGGRRAAAPVAVNPSGPRWQGESGQPGDERRRWLPVEPDGALRRLAQEQALRAAGTSAGTYADLRTVTERARRLRA